MISEFFKAIGEAFASNREESRKADDFFEQSLKKASHDRPPPQPNPKKPESKPAGETFTDPRDGQTYRTVKIGDQVWMAENLNFESPKSMCYDDDPTNGKKYGRLYTWDEAKKACPPGWHLPSKKEWLTLVDFAGGLEVAGKKLKAKSGWKDNGNGTDEYGFSALPGGGFTIGFIDVGILGHWWSTDKYMWSDGNINPYSIGMHFYYESTGFDEFDMDSLFSVRCVQDYTSFTDPRDGKTNRSVNTGKQVSNSAPFTDPRDGKKYRTVKIGDQVWMAENLNFKSPESKCYDDDPANGKKYGRLYTWDEAMKVCPQGWHLPSYEEWDTLIDFAGGWEVAGKKLKAKSGWEADEDEENGNGTDRYGFSALPGGSNCDPSEDVFLGVGEEGYWWSASEVEDNADNAHYRYMLYNHEGAGLENDDKSSLFSVRCVKDVSNKHNDDDLSWLDSPEEDY